MVNLFEQYLKEEEEAEKVEDRVWLETMPFDKEFSLYDGGRKFLHATGYEVLSSGEWWDEYEDPDTGYYYYAR